MTDVAALAWRQYRLERRLFWRNPSAAFFNFLLPLLFLAFFGAIFNGNQHDLDVIVPGIAGMSVMSTTFTALAFNMTFLREQGVLKRIRGTPMPGISYLLGIAGNAVTNTAVADRDHHRRRSRLLRHRLAAGLGRADRCSWPRACCASPRSASPSPTRSPTSTRPPAYVNAVFLPVILISGRVLRRRTHAPGSSRESPRRCRCTT